MKYLYILSFALGFLAGCKKDDPAPATPKTQYYIKYLVLGPHSQADYEIKDEKGIIRIIPGDSAGFLGLDSFHVESGFRAYIKAKWIGGKIYSSLVISDKNNNLHIVGCDKPTNDSCFVEYVLP